jgi:hypothetical protein
MHLTSAVEPLEPAKTTPKQRSVYNTVCIMMRLGRDRPEGQRARLAPLTQGRRIATGCLTPPPPRRDRPYSVLLARNQRKRTREGPVLAANEICCVAKAAPTPDLVPRHMPESTTADVTIDRFFPLR